MKTKCATAYKPYGRRIVKYTRVDGSIYFRVHQKFIKNWGRMPSIPGNFSTFAEAATAVRNHDMNRLKESEVMRIF